MSSSACDVYDSVILSYDCCRVHIIQISFKADTFDNAHFVLQLLCDRKAIFIDKRWLKYPRSFGSSINFLIDKSKQILIKYRKYLLTYEANVKSGANEIIQMFVGNLWFLRGKVFPCTL